jgi:hypothetical protein
MPGVLRQLVAALLASRGQCVCNGFSNKSPSAILGDVFDGSHHRCGAFSFCAQARAGHRNNAWREKIWIEAVAATPGEEGRPDSVPRYEPVRGEVVVRTVPQEQIVLRCTTAISSKFPHQYQRHVELGIIAPDDCYIVAINHAQADYHADVGTPPYILRATLGLGSLYAAFDRVTGAVTDEGVLHRGSIAKASGANVDTTLFLNEGSAAVSAIIGSVTSVNAPADMQQFQHQMGQDFRLVINPMARNPVPDGLLIRGQRVHTVISDDQYQVSSLAID